MITFLQDNLLLISFLFGVSCFAGGFLLCALLVMARRAKDDYEIE